MVAICKSGNKILKIVLTTTEMMKTNNVRMKGGRKTVGSTVTNVITMKNTIAGTLIQKLKLKIVLLMVDTFMNEVRDPMICLLSQLSLK